MYKFGKRFISILLSALIVLALFDVSNVVTKASESDALSNPDPVIDIVVNVPADYPGTFLDFKDELTEKLVAQGLDKSTFRIVSGAVKIDTTNTKNWYLYDHYYDSSVYNSLGLDSTLQPFRQADNSHLVSSTITTIEANLNNLVSGKCRAFKRHILSTADAAGKAKMIFVGYGTNPLTDYMIYPATSDSRRTFSFDIDASCIDTHTLTGAGFFMNAGIKGTGSSAVVNGYLLFFKFDYATSGTVYLKKINNINAMNLATANITSASNIVSQSFSLTSTKKSRVDVDLQSTSVTLQMRNYETNGTLSDTQTLFGGKVNIATTGYNGFGPMTAYSSHACESLSSFTFSDLEMTYEASSFDVLKTMQISENAEYKYFINLAGTNADATIPLDDENYIEGIKRLNSNEIFYISNINDGKVLQNPTTSSSGVGPDNGLYATDDDYISQIAAYINSNYTNKVKYKQVEILQTKEKPIADFIVVADDGKGNDVQVIAAHVKHLQSNTGLTLKIKDKSQTASDGSAINGYRLRVYDPDNKTVLDSDWVSSLSALPTYNLTSDSKLGKYVFELTVRDEKGRESPAYQTFITTFVDEEAPAIPVGESLSNLSKAKITLKDLGYGIDDDGVTLVANEGSGIYKYQINEDPVVTLDAPVNTYSFIVPLTKDPFTVTAWDECGNKITKTFLTAEVGFQNNESGVYYVLSGDKLGELPEGPVSDDPSQNFLGWADEDGNLVSSETIVTKNITLHPLYTTEKVNITFNANGGAYDDKTTTSVISVPKGSKIIDRLLSGDELPSREGYEFSSWTLGGAAISEQIANSNITVDANWSKVSYKLVFDANGGNLGRLKEKSVLYGDSILTAVTKDEAGNDYAGISLPTKVGYLFSGWAIDKNGTDISSSLTMPAETYTVYAKWTKDDKKFIVTFDANGGSVVNEKAYIKESTSVYPELPETFRSGYDFTGWYDSGNNLVIEGTAVQNKTDHTLTAHWSPRNDTQYKIEYYLYDGSKYIRDDSLTVVNKGTTDENCTVSDDEYKDIAGYWFDANNENNVLVTPITGDGKAVLKLYYKRLFNVNVDYSGNGTVTDSFIDAQEGQAPVVSWKPDDGYKVSKIIVDGVIRDDLIAVGSIEFDDLKADHKVYVEFVPDTGDTVDPTIGKTNYYQINTKIIGVKDSCDITETATVKDGSDYRVSWQVKDGYYIKSILVCGVEYDIDTNYVDFTSVKSDKDVVITTAKLPSIGGNHTDGYYTITVNSYGIDESLENLSSVVKPGDSLDVSWNDKDGYTAKLIYLDGKLIDSETIAAGKIDLTDISGDHVIDIYYVSSSNSINKDYNKDYVKVTTQIVGGYGTITGGAMVDKDGTYKVNWNIPEYTTTDTTSPNYKAYEVYKVTVNGEDKTSDVSGSSLTLSDLEEESDVKVYVRPAVYKIDVIGTGNGTVSESKSLYKGQNYLLTAMPDSGNVIAKITIDGADIDISGYENGINGKSLSYLLPTISSGDNHEVKIYFTPDDDTTIPSTDTTVTVKAEINGCAGSVTGAGIYDINGNADISWVLDNDYEIDRVTVNGNPVEVNIDGKSITLSGLNKNPDSADGTDVDVQIYAKKRYTYSVDVLKYGEGTVSSSESIYGGDSYHLTATPADGSTIVKLVINGVEQDITGLENGIDKILDSISGDSVIEVYFDSVPAKTDTVTVKTEISGCTGKITGAGIYDVGSNADIEWSIPDGYEISKVTVNGQVVSVNDSGNGISLTDVSKGSDPNADADIYVKIYATPKDTQGSSEYYDVKTSIQGGPSTITTGTSVRGGDDFDVIWSVADTDSYEVRKVIIDGVNHPEFAADGKYTFSEVSGNHSIEVIVGKKAEINIDVDGDGIPDINIDTDGDGLPDINIDLDGDGNPDINIDTDNTGVWKPSASGGNADGVYKPDTNLDTDGDGKVDVVSGYRTPYDIDGDGVDDNWKPNTNVYPNGISNPGYDTASPLINIDTNGDGIPDINIDTDDDGIPDVNIDTDNDGEPDINIDTDDDGVPDINIDTDGDGEPDTNLDTDGDGVADINIDTDSDGEADIDIDTDGDGKADINIDTDGDGIADINIDIDGDGIADVNIDTDGDGIADKNIDRDGDGVVDFITPATKDTIGIMVIALAVLLELSGIITVITAKRNGYSRLKK